MDTRLILEKVYRLPEPRRRGAGWIRRRVVRPIVRRARRVTLAFWDWVRDHTTRLTLGSLLVGGWLMGHIYYYNQLYDLETNVHMARAHIQAAEQKRNHVQRNLTRLLQYYAEYEKELMKDLTDLRTQESAADARSIKQLLARLDAVAEEYPNLTLTNSVEQFSQIITGTESEITDRIMDYNNAVNIYTTTLGQFPANIFGKPLGFGKHDYYRPADPSVVEYREVEP